MKKITTIFFLLAFYFISYSQYEHYQIGQGRSPLILQEEEALIESHNYLKNDWTKGNMILKDKGLLSNMEFKYDILNDKIEFKSVLNPKSVDIVTIGDKFFIYTEFKDGDYIRNGYFQMIFDGDVRLLIRRTVEIKTGKKGAYGFKSYSIVREKYFIKIGNKPAIPFDRRKGEILDILSDEKNGIKDYVKSNKLNIKRDPDLIKVLEHFEEM